VTPSAWGIALASIVGVPLMGCVGPFAEEFESHYETAAAAREAARRGWIPEGLLPEDAHDVWEFHNIDSSETWGCFSTPSGPATVKTHLAHVRAERVGHGLGEGPKGSSA
jgi:hypothetical protein